MLLKYCVKFINHSLLYYKYLKNNCGLTSYEFRIIYPINILWQKKTLKYKVITNKIGGHCSFHINNQFELSFYGEPPNWYETFQLTISICCFFIILTFLSIQPFYIIYLMFQDGHNIRQYLGFSALFLIPVINFIWLKYYFSTNHLDITFESYTHKYIKYKYVLITSCLVSLCYIIFIIGFFKGEPENILYFSSGTKIGYWFYFLINEFLNKTLIFHNYLITIIVFYKHNDDIKKYIYKLENQSNFILDTNEFINDLIREITSLRSKVERSIYYFNSLISITTILVCFSVFIFFDVVFRQDTHLLNYVDAISLLVFYIIVQSIFFVIIYDYADKRTNLYKAISGHSFLYKYIFIKTIYMQEENNRISVMLNWMILKNILENNWIDFRIMGISSKDGDLIKKSIALASLLIVIFSV